MFIPVVMLVCWSIKSYTTTPGWFCKFYTNVCMFLNALDAMTLTVHSVSRYAQCVKTFYMRRVPYDDRLLKTYNKNYIELGLVSSDSTSHEKNMKLKDILKPREDGKPVRCVLVEGAPGIGKSTLAWEVCHKWEELDSVKQYKLVVLVDLKQKRAQKATCLSDLFIPFENINLKEVISEIGNGEGVLIILDGFDELPDYQQQEGSVYTKLIKHKELLPGATVIITNRPSVSANIYLQKYAMDRQLEISGFTAKGIEEFVRNVQISNNAAFERYINSNPVIKAMMVLPLNAVLVATIFDNFLKTESPYPTKLRMTQLYDALIRSRIRHRLIEKKIVKAVYKMPPSLYSINDINSLPSPVPDQLIKLARIAYEGLCDEQYVFSDLGNDFEHFGLMKMTPNLDDPTRPINKFSFFHSTLQEYLSALYMSLGLPEQNTFIVWRIFTRLWTYICSYFWYTFPDIPLVLHKHDVLLRFLAGMCKHNSRLCEQVGNLVVSDDLQLVQCLYESDSLRENQAIQKVLNSSDKAISIRGGIPFDYYLVGHCFCHHHGVWDIEVDKKEKVDLLVQSLKTFKCSGKIERLSFPNLDFPSLDPLLPLQMYQQRLNLNHITFTASTVNMLKKYMSLKGPLKKIGIHHCEHVEKMLPIVFGPSSLDTLDIVDEGIIYISDRVRKLLQNNLNLKHLILPLILPAHTLCDSTSVDFLAKWLHTFKSYSPKIKTLDKSSEYDIVFYFEKTSADDRTPKIEFQIKSPDLCEPNIKHQIGAILQTS